MWKVAYLLILSLGCSGLVYADSISDSEYYHNSDLAQYRPKVGKAGQKRSLSDFSTTVAFCTELTSKTDKQGRVVQPSSSPLASSRGE